MTPVSITIDIPRMFVNEFLKRIPPYIKYSLYSYLLELKAPSPDIKEQNGMSLILRSIGDDFSENIRITADIFVEQRKEEYIEFLKSLGFQDKRDARLYEIQEMKNI